jgi:hypothetical protein
MRLEREFLEPVARLHKRFAIGWHPRGPPWSCNGEVAALAATNPVSEAQIGRPMATWKRRETSTEGLCSKRSTVDSRAVEGLKKQAQRSSSGATRSRSDPQIGRGLQPLSSTDRVALWLQPLSFRPIECLPANSHHFLRAPSHATQMARPEPRIHGSTVPGPREAILHHPPRLDCRCSPFSPCRDRRPNPAAW